MSTLKKFDKSKLAAAGPAPVAEKELPKKKAVIKKKELQEDEALKQVNDIIHPPVSDEDRPVTKKPKETSIRITIDLPESLHTKLKMYLVSTGFTMKEYMMEVIKKDLELAAKVKK